MTHAQSAGAPPSFVPPQAPPAPGGSVADELRKLADLRDAGLLSEDEFTTQKTRLLGS